MRESSHPEAHDARGLGVNSAPPCAPSPAGRRRCLGPFPPPLSRFCRNSRAKRHRPEVLLLLLLNRVEQIPASDDTAEPVASAALNNDHPADAHE